MSAKFKRQKKNIHEEIDRLSLESLKMDLKIKRFEIEARHRHFLKNHDIMDWENKRGYVS